MQIDDVLLSKLEKLSSLKIADEKKDEIKHQLSEIVSFVEILDELNLDDVDVAVNVLNSPTPLREDNPSNDKEVIDIILSNAPACKHRCFEVPKIIE